jgi:hemerythrin
MRPDGTNAMTLMEWKDSYSVGDSVFDADHKRPIEPINRVDEAGSEGMPVGLGAGRTGRLACYHFRREEIRLEAPGHPRRNTHGKEHAAFIERLATVESDLPRRTGSPRSSRSIGKCLISAMDDQPYPQERYGLQNASESTINSREIEI